MKTFLKIIWIIAAIIIWIIVIVMFNTAWIDEKANDVIKNIQAWNIDTLYSEIKEVEKAKWVENWLKLETFKNAIILPTGQADLRTIKNVSWNWRWFENWIKYIEGTWNLWNWMKINLRLEFIEKDWVYKFVWINWQQAK